MRYSRESVYEMIFNLINKMYHSLEYCVTTEENVTSSDTVISARFTGVNFFC